MPGRRPTPPVWRHGGAIPGRGLPQPRSWLLQEIKQPERILLIETQTEGTPFLAVSCHAPPGGELVNSRGRRSPSLHGCLRRMGRCCSAPTPTLRWLTRSTSPTPERTGIPATGACTASLRMTSCLAPARSTISMTRRAAGSPFIPTRWIGFGLATRPGPSPSRTGPGSGRILRARGGATIPSGSASSHWVVGHIEHLYAEGIAAGSDHAPVMVDLEPIAAENAGSRLHRLATK